MAWQIDDSGLTPALESDFKDPDDLPPLGSGMTRTVEDCQMRLARCRA
ncbi:hypothetical protein ACWCYL_35340 [Streptomyces sp. 900105755]